MFSSMTSVAFELWSREKKNSVLLVGHTLEEIRSFRVRKLTFSKYTGSETKEMSFVTRVVLNKKTLISLKHTAQNASGNTLSQ